MTISESYPDDFVLRCILVHGGAFRAKHAFNLESPKNRYFIILNRSPDEDDELLIATTTTQEAKRRKHRFHAVIVAIDPAEYDSIDKRCVIDCDSIVRWRKTDLCAKVARREVQPLPPVPATVMARIRAAVTSARTLNPHEKNLILGSDQ